MKLSWINDAASVSAGGFCLVTTTQDLSELETRVDAVNGVSSLIGGLVDKGVISGAKGTHYVLPGGAEQSSVVILGLGNDPDQETVRRAVGGLVDVLQANKVDVLYVDGDDRHATAVVEGVTLGAYTFDRYRSEPEERTELSELVFIGSGEIEPLEAVYTMCANANWARDLGNTPGGDLTPAILADISEELARELGCQIDVLDEDDMREKGMNALLAVSQGSREPARLITLRYEGKPGGKTLALVGKGISFDTGGISLKPGAKMEDMKFDMCGAAAVLGAFKSICELGLELNVICAVPTAENMPGGEAVKPGDIVTAYNGKTIEIYNTDAEGRLILADALSYIEETYSPDMMVDLATLTGACIVALGHYASGVMSTSDAITLGLQMAADRSGERIWPLPLWDDFSELVKGHDADVCNIAAGRVAGTVTAGCFLKHFVKKTPWAHLDIAGVAWGQTQVPYLNERLATGYGVRLLAEWASDLAQEG